MSVYAKDYGYFFNSQNNDRTYNADSFETWMKPFFAPGVFQGSLQVTAQATPDLTVNVASGFAFLSGKPAYWATANTMTIDTPSGAYDRIDTIVLRRDDTNRCITLEVVKGTPSATPAATPPTRSATIYELVIAQILVGVGVTGIRAEDITDTRMDSSVCGYVAGAVDQIDFDQIATQFNGWMADYQQDFEDWFANIQGQLDQDAAGHLQNEIDALTTTVNGKVKKSGDIMSGSLRLHGSSAFVSVDLMDVDTTAPEQYNVAYESWSVNDKNSRKMGSIDGKLNTDGKYGARFGTHRTVSGHLYNNDVAWLMADDGTPQVELTQRIAWLEALGLGSIRIIPVTVSANNGTKAFIFSGTCAFTIFTTGTNSTQRSHTHGYCTGEGVVSETKNPSGATSVVFTDGTYKLTLKNTANVTMFAVMIVYGNPDNVELQS